MFPHFRNEQLLDSGKYKFVISGGGVKSFL